MFLGSRYKTTLDWISCFQCQARKTCLCPCSTRAGRMKGLITLLLLLLNSDLLVRSAESNILPRYACDTEKNAGLRAFPFCNTSLPRSERVKDFVARLTLEEKIAGLVTTVPGIPRLGVPPVEWWNEALHGVSWSPGVVFGGEIPAATSFPMPNTIAASFNPSLFYEIGQVVSTEARAMYNTGRAGQTFWSPNVNIYRDPRWGRGQETPGEDPFLAGTFAAQYVKGLQEQTPDGKLKVSACCKHITAYDIDNSTGAVRYDFNALVTEQDLEDTFNLPFQMCVEEGGVSSLMCAYNRVNGVPACADRKFLVDTVRNTWNFDGYIVTDRDSVQTFYIYTNYASTPAEAAADALLAGVDINSGFFLFNYTMDAILQNKVSVSTIDESLSHSIAVQMRLGFFDGDPANHPYGSLGPSDVCTEKNQNLALEAARQGIVLLKNKDSTLPFSSSKIRSIALLGPHGNTTEVMTGNYAGVPCKYTTILQGLQQYTKVVLSPGCQNVECKSKASFAAALDAASKADASVLVMGLNLDEEAERLDRKSLLLPGHQQDLISEVAKVSKGPVVLVILSGGSVDVSFADKDDKVGGIVWAGYPGEAGGQAVADIIFGDYNPGGRLPATWYPESYTSINITNMNMRPDPSTGYQGRTYRFYTGPTLYNFGYGLSYSTVSENFIKTPVRLRIPPNSIRSCNGAESSSSCFEMLTHDEEACNMLKTRVRVSLCNEGDIGVNHALLLFSYPPNAGVSGAPQKQLAAFKRLWLDAKSSKVVDFQLDPCKHISYAAADGKRIVAAGKHILAVGNARHSLTVHASPIQFVSEES